MKISLPLGLAAALAVVWQPAPAAAQLARTYVSAASGNDGAACDRPTPCRTFQVAHDKTLDNGEITVLDAGGYGALIITKSISIINDGVGEAGTLVSGGANGITINGSGINVSLRGLTVKGIGFGGGNGIVFINGNSLTIENCAVRNLTGAAPLGYGIVFAPNTGPKVSLTVFNTVVSTNDNDGVLVQPVITGTGAARVGAVLSHVHLLNNLASGIVLDGRRGSARLVAAIDDSVSAHNKYNGFHAISTGAPVDGTVTRSVAANNGSPGDNNSGFGVLTEGTATLRVGQSSIIGNGTNWWATNTGPVLSYGDNYMRGNGNDVGPSPLIARQ